MSFCNKFKKYVHAQSDDNPVDYQNSKHMFYKIDDWDDEVKKTEDELNITIPNELKDVYKELGYGFLSHTPSYPNRIMPPAEIADFYLGRDIYEFNEFRDELIEDDIECSIRGGKLVFFEIDSDYFLFVSLTPNEKGGYPVYSFNRKIAESVEDFFLKMDEKTNYYFDLFDDI